jgi:hypothetical protein
MPRRSHIYEADRNCFYSQRVAGFDSTANKREDGWSQYSEHFRIATRLREGFADGQ